MVSKKYQSKTPSMLEYLNACYFLMAGTDKQRVTFSKKKKKDTTNASTRCHHENSGAGSRLPGPYASASGWPVSQRATILSRFPRRPAHGKRGAAMRGFRATLAWRMGTRGSGDGSSPVPGRTAGSAVGVAAPVEPGDQQSSSDQGWPANGKTSPAAAPSSAR